MSPSGVGMPTAWIASSLRRPHTEVRDGPNVRPERAGRQLLVADHAPTASVRPDRYAGVETSP
jgi:hypothetical protein